MSLRYGLLGLINNTNTTGYDLSKQFDNTLHMLWKASTSQIYREIDSLIKDGLVMDKIVYQTDKPNKKILNITSKGKTELVNWLSDYENIFRMDETRDVISIRLFFMYNLSIDDAINYVKSCLAAFLDRDRAFAEKQKLIDLSNSPHHQIFYQLTKDYGYTRNKASIEWAKNALLLLAKEKEALEKEKQQCAD